MAQFTNFFLLWSMLFFLLPYFLLKALLLCLSIQVYNLSGIKFVNGVR